MTETMVTSGTMTNRVDRLTRRGLVERLADPSDRRGVIVRLTSAGERAVDGALDALLSYENEVLAEMNELEVTQLADALRALTVQFEKD